MSYPLPPWTNIGQATQVLRLVDTARAQSMVPEPLRIMSVLPGKTIAIVYFADYEPGSAITYHELIIAPALVRLGRHVGWWISHIYVDSPDSMAGGREVWGLPKELARFDWDRADARLVAYQGEQLLCALRSRKPSGGLRLPLFLPAISIMGAQVMAFRGDLSADVGLSAADIEVPSGSPFQDLNLGGHARAVHMKDMVFKASAPWVIGATRAVTESSRV